MKNENKLIDINHFIKEAPLHIDYSYTEEQKEEIYKLIFKEFNLDLFCLECQNISNFTHKKIDKLYLTNESILSQQYSTYSSNMYEYFKKNWNKILKETIKIKFNCTRHHLHSFEIVIRLYNNSIRKIGQFPSLFDLKLNNYLKYIKIIPKDKIKELNYALKLYSNGMGIASYIYAKRVFDQLVDNIYLVEKSKPNWNEESYLKLNMQLKLKALIPELPFELVKNIEPSTKNYLINDLNEEDCLEYYNILLCCIEYILDEELEKADKIDIDHKFQQISNDSEEHQTIDNYYSNKLF